MVYLMRNLGPRYRQYQIPFPGQQAGSG